MLTDAVICKNTSGLELAQLYSRLPGPQQHSPLPGPQPNELADQEFEGKGGGCCQLAVPDVPRCRGEGDLAAGVGAAGPVHADAGGDVKLRLQLLHHRHRPAPPQRRTEADTRRSP